MNKKIYIVEDEAIVALEIKRTILKLGYCFVGMASNYDDAIEGILKTSPDLILMDITLKESKSGIEIAKRVQQTRRYSIIFLTSITDETTMMSAISTEPSGYLLKPFRREELHSAILLAIYKSSEQSSFNTDRFHLGYGYFYQIKEQTLFYKDHYISLGRKEKRLLSLLVEAKGKSVPLHVLEEHIWEGAVVSSSTLRTLLYRLNLKLEYKLIETIPSYGCRLMLDNA